MTSQNDSVIICDSPSPSRSHQWKRTVTNFRKRLRSCDDSKNLLGTIYESPLVHLRRNTGRENAESDVTVVSTPPSKRSKVNAKGARNKANHDQSIVVINDTTGDTVVEIGLSDVETNDVVELPKRRYGTRSSTSAESLLSPLGSRSRRRNRRFKGKEPEGENAKTLAKSAESTSVNDENHNGQIMGRNSDGPSEAEDIEVVWVSDTNSDLTSQGGNASVHQPFVIDTEPSRKNLSKNYLRSHRSKAVKRLGTNEPTQPKGPKRKRGNKSSCSPNSEPCPVSTEEEPQQKTKLREIIIDGANVAMGHKHGTGFSEKGLQIVIDYFKERGHAVRAFLPQYMRKADRALLEKLHTSGHLVFTPSRKIGGKSITPYDDRFILEYATKCDGIVVSSDQYRDLWHEKPQWRDTIEKRLLTPTFVGDYLMFPEDPLGRSGPKLEEFLRH